MSQEEDEQGKRGFKVEDRRRFSESGDVRPERQESAPTDTAATATPTPPPPTDQPARADIPHFDLNFSTFIISLSTQALAHLGEMPHPIDNSITVDLSAAKQLIDILGMIKEKTKGNLDASESGLLDHILYDLRLQYVERVRGRS